MLSYSVLLVQAKNIKHLAGVRDGNNYTFVSSHSGAAFKSNITHCLAPLLHFNNGTNRNEQEQRNSVNTLVARRLGKETDTCHCLNFQAPIGFLSDW